MNTISTQTISIAQFAGIDAAAAGVRDADKPALQGAAAIAPLTSTARHDHAKPELRVAKAPAGANSVSGQKEVKSALGLQSLLAELIGLMLKLELNDSKMIRSNGARETALAQSQASSLRSAGKAAMSGGIARGAAMGLLTFAGAGLQLKGLNRHIGSTKNNMRGSGQTNASLQGNGRTMHDDLRKKFSFQASGQSVAHEASGLKNGKLQAKGAAVNQMAGSAGAVIEGGQTNAVSGHNANREISATDASITGRQVDMDIKNRGRNEAGKEQMFASLKSAIQAQLDVMSHVAQNTRV